MPVLDLAAGIALILFGVRFLRKGLDRLFGEKLIAWLMSMTGNRQKAFLAGTAIGVLAPSSTGLSLWAVQLMGNGQLNAQRMLAVFLGANLGWTATIQLLTFRVQDYAGWFIAAGVFAFQFLARESLRGVGQCLLSFGFIFLALQIISGGAKELTQTPEFGTIFHLLQHHSLATILLVALLTMLLQSSTAAFGLGIGLISTGQLNQEMLINWVLGVNLGLAFTLLAVGWTTLEGRRLGLANCATKLLIALPLFFFPLVAQQALDLFPGSWANRMALLHSCFNLCVGMAALPLLKPIRNLCEYLIPQPETVTVTHQETFLDDSVLETPSLALARAARETLRMGDMVRMILENFWKISLSPDPDLVQRSQEAGKSVDEMQQRITHYLSRISADKRSGDTHWQFALLSFSTELASIADLLVRPLADQTKRNRLRAFHPDTADRERLEKAYQGTIMRLETSLSLILSRDPQEAKSLLTAVEEFSEQLDQIQNEHYDTIGPEKKSLQTSRHFLDLLATARRINGQLATLGHTLVLSRT